MRTISVIGSGGMAAAIGGLAAKAGHTVEVMCRDAARARALAEQVGAGATTGTFGAAGVSPGTTRRGRHASRRSSRASDCARWMPGSCLWRGRWSTPAC
jgi:NADP oxidoreductase coenzyme F420-dependent